MAVTRGLLLDLLATRDTDGVTAAFELFVQLGAAATTQPVGAELDGVPRQPGHGHPAPRGDPGRGGGPVLVGGNARASITCRHPRVRSPADQR